MTPGEKAATEILELAWIKYSDAMLFPDRKGLYIAEMAWIINKGVYSETAELRAEAERLRGALSAAADFHNTEVAYLRAEVERLREELKSAYSVLGKLCSPLNYPLPPPTHGYAID